MLIQYWLSHLFYSLYFKIIWKYQNVVCSNDHVKIQQQLQLQKWKTLGIAASVCKAYLLTVYFMKMWRVVSRYDPNLKGEHSSERNNGNEILGFINWEVLGRSFTKATFSSLIEILFRSTKPSRDCGRNNRKRQHLTVGVTQGCSSWSTMVLKYLKKQN